MMKWIKGAAPLLCFLACCGFAAVLSVYAQEPPSPPTNGATPVQLEAAAKRLRELDALKVGQITTIGDNKVKKVGSLLEYQAIPNAWRGGMQYSIYIFLDGEPKPDGMGKLEATSGGSTIEDVRGMLRMIGLRYATQPGRKVRVAVWNPMKDKWEHPGGKEMPEDWDGLLDLELKVQVGSWSG